MKKMTAEEPSLAQHLIALGCPLDLGQGYRDTPAGLKFEQLPTPGTSQVFDLDKGGSGYVIDMRISSELNLPIRTREVRIQTPWGLRDISLLPDPSQRKRTYQYYEFDGTGLGFHRSVVINDFFSGKRTLQSGDQIEGLLLAVDQKAIPDSYPEHGHTVVELLLLDMRGNSLRSEFRLCVDRSATVVRERKNKTAAVSPSKSRLKREPSAA